LDQRTGPAATASADPGPVEGAGDVSQAVPLGPFLVNPRDDGLLVGVFGESAGSGLDWFWDVYAQDHTNRKATDVLN
jgi:hypothetical protein